MTYLSINNCHNGNISWEEYKEAVTQHLIRNFLYSEIDFELIKGDYVNGLTVAASAREYELWIEPQQQKNTHY